MDSARLRLRPMSVDDAAAMHLVYADEEAMRWWSHPPHISVEETRESLARHIADPAWRSWAVTLTGDDTAIGSLAAHEKRQGKVVEIGYSLVRSHWGQGYAREAVARLIDRLIREEGMRRVFADTDPENDASNRLLESLGFVREGHLRGEWETHIGVRDSFIWGLLAEEWIR
ncbi:GNAT family N-acetyltransferase [Sphingomonas sp. RT2P30]|uniref:GNAT family N-acetyltransferase n=1 Tax=Parasphingomonas halimpatiens TaxID=3096162 RepID=UPI002FC858CD